ncbi:hypothetical protein PF006_g25807 [Phytophthora fragariae]|uniref:Uncharacterized protein n=1 Tax=Phytophthora fragariae TaxID=53985 RepID=A0A6A3R1X7_9STRA|nr:hypothetical protein PF003_g6979 [Phytophthora fragariae]KAE9087434.1 hypothetical protein PF006_g25807 [Phytophthora fragariae]KAE9295552.1 hypothetical protein PF008_g24236 [Phytophthora fragariae]
MVPVRAEGTLASLSAVSVTGALVTEVSPGSDALSVDARLDCVAGAALSWT